jgi:hypothetical protein
VKERPKKLSTRKSVTRSSSEKLKTRLTTMKFKRSGKRIKVEYPLLLTDLVVVA